MSNSGNALAVSPSRHIPAETLYSLNRASHFAYMMRFVRYSTDVAFHTENALHRQHSAKLLINCKKKSEASVCATVSASINPLPSDRLRCCDRYIRCQRSLAVKQLNSRPAMYVALQLLGVRDDSWLSETSLTTTARGGEGGGCWTVDFDSHVQHYTQTDATSHCYMQSIARESFHVLSACWFFSSIDKLYSADSPPLSPPIYSITLSRPLSLFHLFI